MMATPESSAIERILALVNDRTGLRVKPSRAHDAEAGVRRAMGRAGDRDPLHYLSRLERGELSLDGLLAELTVRETYFFRDAMHLDFVRRQLVPDSLARRGPEHVFRLWSAGCASGEEAYSLAMLFDQEQLPASILGTDLSRDALRAAREGVYSRWSLRALQEHEIARWFQRTGERWRLHEAIRQRVSFEFHNLLRHAYPLPSAGIWGLDAILCRNVLMYFDASELERVARGFHDSLAEHGWLITGPSDPSLDGLGSLRAVSTEAGVFYQRMPARVQLSAPPARVAHSASPAPWVAKDWSAPAGAAPEPPPSPASVEPAPAPERQAAAGHAAALAAAQRALDTGDYERVGALLRDAEDEASALLCVRALANCGDREHALSEARRQARRHWLSPALHFLEALLAIDAGHSEEAIGPLRRVLYLDPSAAAAQFVLGSQLRRLGKREEARRAYRRAYELARCLPAGAILPLTEGETAGCLAEMAEAELTLLSEREVVS